MSNLRNTLRHLNPENQRRFLRYCRWLRVCEYFHTPAPVAFGLVASLSMFALLPLMPLHPLSIPTVIGAGLSFALLLQIPSSPYF